MQQSRGSMSHAKHRSVRFHKFPRSRYAYEACAKQLNADADRATRRRAAARAEIRFGSVIEAFAAARRR